MRPKRPWIPPFVLALGLCVTAAATAYVDATAEARDRAQFRADVQQTKQAMAHRLEACVALLRAAAGLLSVKPDATASEFQAYVEALRLPRDYPEIVAVGLARNGAGPAGVDAPSEASQREAMERARDTGEPASTGRVRLSVEPEGPLEEGFFVYLPVYAGPPPASVDRRRAALAGFVHAAFRGRDLFRRLSGDDERPLDFAVHDSAERTPEHLLHESAAGPPPASYRPRFTGNDTLAVAGRSWGLSFTTRPEFDRASGLGLVPFVIGGGLLVSAVLFLAARAQALSRAEADARASELLSSEKALRSSELRLRKLYRAEGEARHSAEVANRAKDEFLATLSHELRTPLTAMMGWVRMLRSGRLDGAASARGLEVIERNVKLQAQLIEDLLDVSRIITGKLRLDVRPVEIAPVLEGAIDAVRHAAVARQIELVVLGAGPELKIMGDPDRLQQVVWNLLANAVRFTPRGGRVEISVEREGVWVKVLVSDSGKGISPDFLPFVFDRFRQADSSIKRTHGGLGLGLSIVRHLVELHGGTVDALSPGEGLGATFVVSLPATARDAAPESEPPRAPPGEASCARAAPSLAGLSVLVVDDEPDARELLGMVLEQGGAAVVTAASAAEAMEALGRSAPDVLVSDIAMPAEDGYSLIRRVRALDPARGGRVPAAALTAYAREEDRRRALSAGFQMHVPKPIEPAELLGVVARLAGRLARSPASG